ncbi:hypothetical protein DUNSADRAFT_12305 [Dunaliella salina]|uniref:Encoded protein n=1 Tax=Dunaliella salina TaxID=3046 RepID=A0ABQ7GBJ7_DUNSA|nr:hypothetical protein DUNSADRAFT_12305 [Dunaliella salina]|eukprot:KAF5831990.1 hypothetical protein DUNSADRAFT_12305 [Dunaliella salina]
MTLVPRRPLLQIGAIDPLMAKFSVPSKAYFLQHLQNTCWYSEPLTLVPFNQESSMGTAYSGIVVPQAMIKPP